MTIDTTRLQELSDRAAIAAVQYRYATASDSHDIELLRSCFGAQVEIDFSSGFGSPVVQVSADEWVRNASSSMGGMTATHHLMTNLRIEFSGADHATCVTYVQANHHKPNPFGDSDQAVYGHYTNRFERTPEGWRIVGCKLTSRWMTGNFGIYGDLDAHWRRVQSAQ
ncbi:nuclear transport factor 2 family protein [uncultured Jatrophihabitans sp.]|uniref:nuclear transport factor 2 family protein n=1 Tax=uncultured Jatrophihabitans sp. TaxID=1610747 RepID=UPI0035C97A4E